MQINLNYSWQREADRDIPVSRSDFLNQDNISLLDCLLMDSGGLRYAEIIPWLEEGLKRVKSVETGETVMSDWSRETWGVSLRNQQAKIYSLYDEAYFQMLSLDGFSKALQQWIVFLQAMPDDGNLRTFNFSIDG